MKLFLLVLLASPFCLCMESDGTYDKATLVQKEEEYITLNFLILMI